MHKKLWLFNKKLYNFNNFINNHPGGKWVIEESKGHDITYLVQNNHNWTKEQAVNRLKKYEYKTFYLSNHIHPGIKLIDDGCLCREIQID